MNSIQSWLCDLGKGGGGIGVMVSNWVYSCLATLAMVDKFRGFCNTHITPHTQTREVCITGRENLKNWQLKSGRNITLTDFSHCCSLTLWLRAAQWSPLFHFAVSLVPRSVDQCTAVLVTLILVIFQECDGRHMSCLGNAFFITRQSDGNWLGDSLQIKQWPCTSRLQKICILSTDSWFRYA